MITVDLINITQYLKLQSVSFASLSPSLLKTWNCSCLWNYLHCVVESSTIRLKMLLRNANGVSLVLVGSGWMRVMGCVLCDRCVSADGGEWRLSVSCGHSSLHEARRPPQLPAVLQTRRHTGGEWSTGENERSGGQIKSIYSKVHWDRDQKSVSALINT